MLDLAAAALPVSRPGLRRRVLRRSRRLAGAAVGDRRRCRVPARCERQPRRRVRDLAGGGRADGEGARGGGGLHRRRAGGHRVRGEHDDAELPARACRGAHDVAGGRDRRDRARPRRERLALARGGRRSRPRGAHRAAAGRGHDARRRRPRGADRRAHPRGGVHAGLERGRLDSGCRPHRGGRSRRRRARVGGRGSHGAAPAAARTGARARRPALLAVQVLRAAPRDRVDPARPRGVAAGGPGAAGGRGSARAPLRDRHAVARGDRRGARRDRVPARRSATATSTRASP